MIKHKQKALLRIFCMAVAVMLSLTAVFAVTETAYAADGSIAVKKSNYVISDMDSATAALSTIASDRQIPALVYLKDVYTIRSSADAYSDNVATVATGQLVYIIGVSADAGRNIWYKIRCKSDSGAVTGFVEREFLACSDERFLEWEDKYVTTVGRETTASVTDCADIEAFPESYRDALYKLKAAHPDWIFVKQNTGLDFKASVASEGKGAYSLIYTKSAKNSWIEAKYDDSWSYATDGIIAYYMDPRNFLTETQVFQFEQQTYNPGYHTESSVQRILNGTFMAGSIEEEAVTYASAFMSLAQKYNISPILQAARVRQEQGVSGTSALISGKYPGYEGYYNYYNVGAVSSNPIVGGLTYAKEHGWNSRLTSLDGGVRFLCNSYVNRGQDTLYLQKFDVDASYDGVLTHQYMQNIAAPSSEADSAYKGYKTAGLMEDTPFVFRIPVYNNMPSGRSVKPDSNDELTLNVDIVENLPVDQSAVVIPYINGGLSEAYTYSYVSSDSTIASVDDKGVITGVKPGEATITCRAGAAGSSSCRVSVIKADIAISDVEKPDIHIAYDPAQTLADIELPDSFAWIDLSTVPVVNNQGYTVMYSPDNSRYNSIAITLDVNVDKAVVSADKLEIPAGITASAGAMLSTVALPNYYIWEDGSQIVSGRAGNYVYKAAYCIDEANYEATEGIDIPVEVICTRHSFSEWEEADDGYMYRSCTICGETESVKKDELVEEEDCITQGHIMVDGVCSRCGYEEPPLQEHIHEYSLLSDTATCTEAGIRTYICSCKDSYTEESKALGHHMVTENGNYRCDRCGYIYVPTAAVTPIPTVVTTPETAALPVATPESTGSPVATPESTGSPVATPESTGSPVATPESTGSSATTPATEIVVPPAASNGSQYAEYSPVAEQPVVRPQITKLAEAAGESEPSGATDGLSEHLQADIEAVTAPTDAVSDAIRIIDAGDGASWSIAAAEADGSGLDTMDMTVVMGEADIPDNVISSLENVDYVLMSIAHDGAFGFEAVLGVNVGTKYSGRYANLYYYNPDRNRLELVQSVKVNAAGEANFTMNHASDYVITFTDRQMIAKNGSNTMLFVLLAVILAGGIGVLVFVLVRMNKVRAEDEEFYFDLDDDR